MDASASTSSSDVATKAADAANQDRCRCSDSPPCAPIDAGPFPSFLQYLTEQRTALLKRFGVDQPHGAPEGPPETILANAAADPDNLLYVREVGASAEAASENSAPSCISSSVHVHQLQRKQIFLPTPCGVCKAVMLKEVWSPSRPSQASSTELQSSPASSLPPDLSSLPTSPAKKPVERMPLSDQCAPPQAAPFSSPAMSPSSSATPSPTTAADTAAGISQRFLGFGSEGYRCNICGLALHFSCLARLRQSQACEVLAPAAHPIESCLPSSSTSSTLSTLLASSKAARQGVTSPSASYRSFSAAGVRSILKNYLDPDDGANSRRDNNVKALLEGLFALLDAVMERHPTLTPFTFVKRYSVLQDLSNLHQLQYAACVASLKDTTLLHHIRWDALRAHRQARCSGFDTASSTSVFAAMRPLCMDKSTVENLKAGTSCSRGGGFFASSLFKKNAMMTPAEPPAASDDKAQEGVSSAWPLAQYPIQLLLWEAMRCSTAAYGEVYRRGSLSSTLSTTLLFTLQRSSVSISKRENDSAVTTLLGLPSTALRLSRWSSRVTEPSYALLVDDAAGLIVVAFRGTLNTFDVMTDLAAACQPFCGGYAHQGAAAVVNTLFEQRASRYEERKVQRGKAGEAATAPKVASNVMSGNTEDAAHCATVGTAAASLPQATEPAVGEQVLPARAAQGEAGGSSCCEAANESVGVVLKPYVLQPLDTPDGLLDGLEQLAAENPSYSILITGHSLGGGVAVLFATRLHQEQVLAPDVLRRIRVIAFAPMPTLSLPAASCFDEVSCARADGGYGFYDAACQNCAVRACFPVWNVVNGLDFIPRLQVNTIDRLLRHVLKSSTRTDPDRPPGVTSARVATSTEDAGNRSLRELHVRDTAACGAGGLSQEEMEMTDMPARMNQPIKKKSSSPGAHSDHMKTVADHDVQDAAQAQVAEEQIRDYISCDIETREALCENLRGVDVVVHAAPGSVCVDSSCVSPGTDFEGSRLPAVSELFTSVSEGAQGESQTGSAPSTVASSMHTAPHLSHELYHPGRVLLFTTPWDVTSNRLVDVPRGHPVMHELFLAKSMLMEHGVDAYIAALRKINESHRHTGGAGEGR